VESAALTAIARMADGGYRDALTLLEQAMLTSENKITLQHVYDQLGLVAEEIVDGILIAMRHGNVHKIMELLDEVSRRGRDPRAVLESMMYRLQDLTRAAYTVDVGASSDATAEASLFETASHIGRENLLWLRGGITEAHKAIRDVSLPRIWLEAELIRIATMQRHPVAQAVVQAQARAETPPRVEAPQATPTEPKPPEPKPRTEAAKPDKPLARPEVEQPAAVKTPDSPSGKWDMVVKQLTTKSKSMGMRLSSAKLAAAEGGELTIEFQRETELNWIVADEKSRDKQKAILEVVRTHFGDETVIRYVLNKNGDPTAIAEPEAVELPVEGEPLHKLASDILGQNGNSK
jgi:DNA polymerase-3 subunit gamma/tau